MLVLSTQNCFAEEANQVKHHGENNQQTQESWKHIIEDLATYNPAIKAAHTAYKFQLAKSGLNIARVILPDSIRMELQGSAPLNDVFKQNIFNGKNGGQKMLVFSKRLGLHTLIDAQTAAAQISRAKSNYETLVIKEIKELLPFVILLSQKQELLDAHETNMKRLKRNLKSIEARADKAIGIASQADLANAKAEYEAGQAAFTAIKQQLFAASEYFKIRVGRPHKADLSGLKAIDVAPNTDPQEAPEVKNAFNAYNVARFENYSATSRTFLPDISAAISKSNRQQRFGNNTDQDVTSDAKIEAQISWNLYSHDSTQNNLTGMSNARQSLHQYQYQLQTYTHKKQIFSSEDAAKISQLNSTKLAYEAAERYATAEQRKFNNAFQEMGDGRIISPDRMLRALNQAHEQKLSYLNVQRNFIQHRIQHLLEFGMLTSV